MRARETGHSGGGRVRGAWCIIMMDDAGIKAKEAAVRKVTKLLPPPYSMKSINSIRSNYALQLQHKDAQLSKSVVLQAKQIKADIDVLSNF